MAPNFNFPYGNPTPTLEQGIANYWPESQPAPHSSNYGFTDAEIAQARAAAATRAAATAAATTAATTASAGGGSNADRYLSMKTVNGQNFDISTPEGQISYANAVHQANLISTAKSFTEFQNKQNMGLATTAANYASAKAGFSGQDTTIGNQAKQYAQNYANQGAALENSYGTNLAQIGATYGAASPGVFQSSQAYDTNYADVQHAKGVASLNSQRDTQVGNNYILGTNPDGSLQLGSLANDSTLGIAKNSNAAQSAAADTNYGLYTANAGKELNSEKQQEALNLNSQEDQTANDTNRLNAYAGKSGTDFGRTNYTNNQPQSLDLSAYTSSPLTAAAAGAVPGANYNNYGTPAGVSNQSSGSQFLGYAPDTVQGGFLSQFLKAGKAIAQ